MVEAMARADAEKAVVEEAVLARARVEVETVAEVTAREALAREAVVGLALGAAGKAAEVGKAARRVAAVVELVAPERLEAPPESR